MFNRKLDKKIDELNNNFEKANLQELSYILGSRKELIKRNLLSGILRGVGIGIGFTIITAIIVLILRRIVMLNIPIIGEYIGDVIDIIENTR